jgi:hypothetical protein
MVVTLNLDDFDGVGTGEMVTGEWYGIAGV